MFKNKKFFLFATLILALSVFLAACGDKDKDKDGGKDTGSKDNGKDNGEEVANKELDFPMDVSNKNEPMEDGELTHGLISDSPFEGTLNKVFYQGQPDAEVMGFFDENLLAVDGDYLITNDGAATYELSDENKTITIKIGDNVNWHDGEPVKSTDLLYSYELLGHPDYTGTRYTPMISRVVGMEDYHAGKTKEIEGIKIINDKELSITYTEATPSVMSGIWTAATPRHHVGDVMTGEITVEDLEASDKIRTNPIGFGPYKVQKIVPGESVLFERNDDYYKGKPALKSIALKVVSTASAVDALKKGDIDVASVPVDQYEKVKEVDNIELLANIDNAYTYIGFKLGKWDGEKKENVTDPDSKLADKRVRQAMWYAMDNKSVGEKFYHNLRIPATTLVIPFFASFHDDSIEAPSYDPEKAKALLEEAGFKDTNGDGFVEDPEGNEFVLNFASMSGGETAEPLAMHYIQNWADVGIKVELTDGRLHEFNSFYDMVEADDPKIDIYQGAWGTGTDPDPTGLYGRTAGFNYTRFTSEENDRLLEEGISNKAFDEDFRKQVYSDWQKLMVDEVPVAPTLYRYSLMGVNKRVVNYSVDPASELRLWQMGVSE